VHSRAVLAALAAAGVLALTLQGELELQLGVWRFAVFGLVLAVTVRFRSNGLVLPLLERLGGSRAEFKEDFLSARGGR
jgi:hypothetical protein